MNPINVAKFGGTSVADAAAMNHCADVVLANPATRVVVLSASAGVTNLLASELSSGEPFGLIDMPIPFYSQISIEIINQIAR